MMNLSLDRLLCIVVIIIIIIIIFVAGIDDDLCPIQLIDDLMTAQVLPPVLQQIIAS
jgi:hypothetical protein